MLPPGGAPASGFVLAGGRSTRMGTDKALLARDGRTLLERVAAQVEQAAGNVTIVADPQRYGHFGWPVIADRIPGRGPLGGIVTALEASRREWNLVVACDMPGLDHEFLAGLIAQACELGPGIQCLAPAGPGGPEPLCAVYRLDALIVLRNALEGNILKMRKVLDLLEVRYRQVPGGARFSNINTMADWLTHD